MSTPVARARRELAREPPHVAARVVEHAVGLQRQPAAVLPGARRPRSRCARAARRSSRRAAARSSSCRSRGSRRPASSRAGERWRLAPSPGTCARRTCGIAASRWMPTTFSTSDRAAGGCAASSSRAARRACRARPATVGRAEQLVAQLDARRARCSSRARLRVDLRDVHALRAHLRADAAARAVVDRGVGRRLVGDAEALGLRADVLRPREQRRHVRERAERLADRALHAVVERVAHRGRTGAASVVIRRPRPPGSARPRGARWRG